jgi:hypothetical protein
MRWFLAFAERFVRVPGLGNPVVRHIAAAVVLIVLAALAIWFVLWLVASMPGRFWQLVVLAILIIAVLWWFLRGAKRFEQRGVSRKRLGDLGPGNPADEAEAVKAMTQAIAEAKRTVLRAPEIERGRDPLYRVPWFLVIGDEEAGQEQLLRVAARVSPFQAPRPLASQPNQLWQWWFFRQLLAIQTSERFVCETGARLERGIWYQGLQLLAAQRDQLPLNGIVVCVAATALVRNDETFRNRCVWLRRLVDEAMEHLQLQLPVYFVVTKLDALPGFAAFAGTLPKEAERQAVGWRLEADVRTSAASSGRVAEIFDTILKRLHAVRLAAVKAELRPPPRKGVYDFVESFKRLRGGLETFVRLLLEDNPFQRTPQWRGLYFAATDSRPAFTEDLFTHFLPVDQPLAAKNQRSRFWQWSRAAVGVAGVLAVSTFVSHGIMTAARQDVPVLEHVAAACPAGEGLAGAARLSWVASCGRQIDAVESMQAGLAFGFGVRRSAARVRELKQTLVDDFSRLILAPYDQTLEQDIAGRRLAFDHFLAVAQRLRLIRQCRSDAEACRRDALGANYAFDPRSRLYAPFVAAAAGRSKEEQSLELMQAYIGYVRWQDRDVLEQEEERLKGLLRTMLDAHELRPADVARWAQTRPSDVTLARFWRPGTSTAAADASLPSVSAAYLHDVWLDAVGPVYRELAEYFPEKKTSLAGFFEAYQREYFRNWGAFLKAFPEGFALWAGRGDELIKRAGTPDSPYVHLWKALEVHIYALPIEIPFATRRAVAWDDVKDDWTRAPGILCRLLRSTVAASAAPGVAAPPAWVPALLEYRYGVLREQAPVFAKAYLRLQGDDAGQESYQVAAEIFLTKGNPAKPPAAEYAPLLQAVDKPNEKYAPLFTPEDQAAWSIVQGPSRLLLALTLFRAGQLLQAQWEKTVVAPARQLPQREQIDFVYGERGKFAAFVNDWLKPFVSEKERQPIRVAGVALPLAPSYQGMLNQEGKLAPVLGAEKPFFAGVFEFTQPSALSRLKEGPAGTTLEVECKERVFVATTRAESLSDWRANVYWSPVSCLEARLRIALPEPPPAPAPAPPRPPPPPTVRGGPGEAPAPAAAPPAAPKQTAPPQPLRLTRTYPGPEGFIELLREFQDGSHSYGLGDFRKSYSAAQWQEIAQRASALGVDHARVFLRIKLSEEMERYLGGRGVSAAVPTRLFE